MNAIEFFKENQEKFISLFGFAMVFVFGFFSGYYYLLEKVDNRGITIEEPSADCAKLFNTGGVSNTINVLEKTDKPDSAAALVEKEAKSYVASKNSKIFHLPSCSFASKIKEENKVWFSSKEEAQNEGYSPHECVKK